MKKNLLISVFTVFALMLSVNTFAQEKATKKDYKTMAKQEKVLNNELKKKALKDARKEAKKLTKEGFKTPIGKLPLDKQIENAWQKQAEMTPDELRSGMLLLQELLVVISLLLFCRQPMLPR